MHTEKKQNILTFEKLEPVKDGYFIDKLINFLSAGFSSTYGDIFCSDCSLNAELHFAHLVCPTVMHPMSLCLSHLICLSHTNTHTANCFSSGCLTLTLVTFSEALTDCFFYSISACYILILFLLLFSPADPPSS